MTPPLPAARRPRTWHLRVGAGPRRQCPTLGCRCGSLEAPRRSHGSLCTPVFPPRPELGQWGSPFLPCPHPQPFPEKAAKLPAPGREGGPDPGVGMRAESASKRRASVPSPPQACPRDAGPGRPAGTPTRRASCAGTWPLGAGSPTATCTPCARPGLQTRPGRRHRDFRAAPPSPAAALRACIWSLRGGSAAASKTGRRLCEPGCPACRPLPSAPTSRPRPALTFSGRPWGSVTAPGLSATAAACWRVQQEGVAEAPAPSLNPSQAVTVPARAGHRGTVGEA